MIVAGCGPGRAPPRASGTFDVAPASSAPPIMIDNLDGLGLFDDELGEARAILATWARTRGFAVVDPGQTSTVLARAALGQDVRTGAACGRPLRTSLARTRWASELGGGRRLTAFVRCDDATRSCVLHVAVRGSGWDDDPTIDAASRSGWRAPFDASAPWGDALPRALAALAPAPADDLMGGFGVGSTSGKEVRAAPEHLAFSTVPARASDSAETFADAVELPASSGLSALRACMVASDGTELMVSSDADGRVTRCVGRGGSDAAALCACALFTSQGTVKAAARAARFYVRVGYRPADVVAQGKAVVSAHVRTHLVKYPIANGQVRWRPSVSDPSIEDWAPPPDWALTACFADLASGAFHFRVRTHFDAGGHPTNAVAEHTAGESPTPAQVACLEHAFLASSAPCPAAASTHADVEVTVVARTIGKKATPIRSSSR